jgi:hypothetical protein
VTNAEFIQLIGTDEADIIHAISSGAAWEVWMQVELLVMLRRRGIQAARELPYPYPFEFLKLDMLFQDNHQYYAVELKVESATNAGAQILTRINVDRQKIANYIGPNVTARWVVGIAYSDAARAELAIFAGNPANNAIYAASQSIGILIATV